MKIKIISERKKKELDEMSSVGAVSGFAGGVGVQNRAPNAEKDDEEEKILGEMYSSSGATIGAGRSLTSDDDNDTFDGQKERAKMQGLKNVIQEDNVSLPREMQKEFDEIGLDPIKVLGSGKFGTVYLAISVENAAEGVVKVIGDVSGTGNKDENAMKRESYLYSVIGGIRPKYEEFMRHFPKVYGVRKFPDRVYIMMEKLEPAPKEALAFIPDDASVIAGRNPFAVTHPNDVQRGLKLDMNQKAREYQKDLADFSSIVVSAIEEMTRDIMDPDMPREGITQKQIKDLIMKATPPSLEKFQYHYEPLDANQSSIEANKEIRKMKLDLMKLVGFGDWQDVIDTMEDEVSGEAAYTVIPLLYSMILIATAGKMGVKPRNDNEIDYMISKRIASHYINKYRSLTSIKIKYQDWELKQKEKDRFQDNAPGKDLFRAIQLLYKETGLMAFDVHDQNVMMRPETGDLVIVDLGSFRRAPAGSWKPPAEETKPGEEVFKESLTFKLKILTNRRK
jgi:hypothetical protein